MSNAPIGMIQAATLKFREEGAFWNAYVVIAGSPEMHHIGSVAVIFVHESPDVRERFIATMRACVDHVMRKTGGLAGTWGTPRPATPGERGGTA